VLGTSIHDTAIRDDGFVIAQSCLGGEPLPTLIMQAHSEPITLKRRNKMRTLKKAALLVLTIASLGSAAGMVNAGVTSSRDIFTTGGHTMGTRDPFTDGGHTTATRDLFSDGAHTTGTRDTFTDGSHTGGTRDAFTDGI
jgi:hypothetical protein